MVTNGKSSNKTERNGGFRCAAWKFLEVGFETITPEQADKYLKNNAYNQRKLSMSTVRQYAREMINRQWFHDTGECIKFSDTGQLIDGQHRLKAVVLSRYPQIFLVMRNVSQAHIRSMDLGKKRTVKDIIEIHEMKIPTGFKENHIGALSRSLWDLYHYSRTSHKPSKEFRTDSTTKAVNPTALELFNFLENNLHFVESLSKLQKLHFAQFLKRGFSYQNAIGWYAVYLIDPEIADTIFKSLRDGYAHSNFGHDCPSMKLLQYIKNRKENKSMIRAPEYPALWLWAFEHMHDKKKPKHLKLSFSNMPCQGHTGSKKLREELSKIRF